MILRTKYLDKIKAGFALQPIVVLIGARQVGKTSLMKIFQIEGKSLFLNGQDPEVSDVFSKMSVAEQYLKVYLNSELKGYILLDEFQFIPNVSTMLKLLTDKYPDLRILCSGSSSLDILAKIEESLAGRVRTIEVLSLSFEEYLLFKDVNLSKLYESFDENTEESPLSFRILSVWEEYLQYGGLPRAALTENEEEKITLLDNIYKTYLLKDVRAYIANEHFIGFNKLLRLLAVQIGNLVNINELSRETALPYKKCEEYLALLEQMYIIKLVEPFYTNKRKVITKMKKVYFCDLGLRNIIYASFNEMAFRTDNGAIFENYVLLELWRKQKVGSIINFYRTVDGAEVDFVINNLIKCTAWECKYKQLDKSISIPSLTSFSNIENISCSYIVNRNLNKKKDMTHLIPGYLIGKVQI